MPILGLFRDSLEAQKGPFGLKQRSTFNPNTVKVSYRTMTNMAQVLAKHNNKVIVRSRPAPTIDEGCH